MSQAGELTLHLARPPEAHAAQRFLAANQSAITRRLSPFGMDPERWSALALTEVMRTPALLACMSSERGQAEFQLAIFEAAQVGLEFNPRLGHVFLIPNYHSREHFMGVRCQYGWKGVVQLMHRSPLVRSVYAEPVYPEDEFEWYRGDRPRITHQPRYEGPPDYRRMTHVYAVCLLRGQGKESVVLTKGRVEHYRKKSQQPNGEAWGDPHNAEGMARKTALLRLWPECPMETQQQEALALVQRREDEPDDDIPAGQVVDSPPHLVSAGRDRRRQPAPTPEPRDAPVPPGTAAAPEPPPPDTPPEPAAAAMPLPQEIATVCREAGIDRALLIRALTDQPSAADLTEAEAEEVLRVARCIQRGEMRFSELDGQWRVVEVGR